MGVPSAFNIVRLITARLPQKLEIRRMVFNGRAISPSCYQSELHGLLETLYDRENNLSLYSISQIFEHSRVLSFSTDTKEYLGTGDKTIFNFNSSTETMFFMIAGRYVVLPELYTTTNRSNFALRVKVSEQLTGLGRSTLHFRGTMTDMSSDKSLATFTYNFCLANAKTRKAEPLPDWFRTAFRSFTTIGEKFQPQPLPVDKAYSFQYTVVSSDIDCNVHVNHSIYIRLCFDCGSLAIQQHRLRNFNKNNLSQYHVQSFDVVYNREALEGDNVTAYVWEDEASVGILHFQINRDTEHLFYGRASFHDFSGSKL